MARGSRGERPGEHRAGDLLADPSEGTRPGEILSNFSNRLHEIPRAGRP